MNDFFGTNNKIRVNNKSRKCEEDFFTGGVNERHFARPVSTRAAPSSGHLLHRAKTINLMNLLLVESHEYYVYCRLCVWSLREDVTNILKFYISCRALHNIYRILRFWWHSPSEIYTHSIWHMIFSGTFGVPRGAPKVHKWASWLVGPLGVWNQIWCRAILPER